MTPLAPILRRLVADLDSVGLRWALVGGLAVSVRAEPRTTRDLDVAVAVSDDREAEQAVLAMRSRGYRDADMVLEQLATGRLATMRMMSPPVEGSAAVIDLMFASSGIEPEIVRAATRIEALPQLSLPVATLPHLVAMKVLAGRHQDLADFAALFRYASQQDLEDARTALELITDRRSHRDKRLLEEFDRLCRTMRSES